MLDFHIMKKDNGELTHAKKFYRDALKLLNEAGIEYMLGGGYALFHYTGIKRESKDLDIFCRPRDYPKILKLFEENKYKTELSDARWLAKVFKGKDYMDIIFDSANAICTVSNVWFDNARKGKFEDVNVLFIPPEELYWCKVYIHNRERYDGADLNHLLITQGKKMDWKRIYEYMDKHWQLLLSQLLIFQFVYPGDYASIVPAWLFEKLLELASEQAGMPATKTKVCRGPIIDQTQYEIDIKEWDYKVSTMKTV